MALSFVGKSAFGSGTASVSAAAVTGVQAGDLLLIFVESANQPIASIAGYTQVTGSPVQTGTANAAGGVALQVFYAFATGADSSTTVGDAGDHTTAIKLAYRGVDQTTPFDATAVTGIKTPASTSSSFPGITTATAGAWVIHASALDLDLASTATTGTPTNANLTGLTERHDQTVTSGFGGGLVIIDGVKAAAGASGNTTATVTSTVQVYMTLALRAEIGIGTFAATETGADTLSATGGVVIRGPGAATESGADALSAAGSVSDGPNFGVFAAAESGSDTATAVGKVIVKGALSASESGQDALSAAGKVVIGGALASSETGSDAFASAGKVIVNGSVAGAESGGDTIFGSGGAVLSGALAADESGDDVLAASGKVLVQGAASAVEEGVDGLNASGSENTGITGSLSATESPDAISADGSVLISGSVSTNESPDAASATGQVLVAGSVAASETDSDAMAATGGPVVQGVVSATEAGSDTFGGYITPGYIEPGFFDTGSAGTVKNGFNITGAQALLLRRLCQLHGLIDALEIGPSTRRAGDLVQSITESAGTVTIRTTSAGTAFNGTPGEMIEELAALHGLTEDLVVTKSSRQAGSIVQAIASSGNSTTVARQ